MTLGLSIAYFLMIIFQMSQAKSAKTSPESLSYTGQTQTEASACYNFSVGDPVKKEFFSPNYPNPYPKSVTCTLRITANPGQTITLDFRDKFHLENSANCDFDRLEVRDGAYGYSALLGIFCGNQFPKKIFSTKRYMWLRFKSDDSIEYDGFKAVYEFKDMKNQGEGDIESERECSFRKSGPSGIILKEEINHLYSKYKKDDNIECMWTIETDPTKKIYVHFTSFNLEMPNNCDENFVQIFEGGPNPDNVMITFCGTTAEPLKTKGNITHIRLFTSHRAFNNTDFKVHFTTYRELSPLIKNDDCDANTEFNCGDQTCIDLSLRCDGQNDCKYRYDEENCDKAMGAAMVLTSEHMIIILVVFFSLVIAMCASISISCYNKIKERQIREREYKQRRSKEASVEATIDRNLRGHSTPDRISDVQKRIPPQAATASVANFEQAGPGGRAIRDFADDEESSDGCYVPEVDLSVFKHPNGGETIPKKPRAAAYQQPPYPYISESFESLESDVIVPPAPPPVPQHMKDRRDVSPPPPTYRIVGGKVVANPAKNEPTLERMQKQPLGSSRSTLDSKGGSSYGRWPPDSRPSSTKPASGPAPYPGFKYPEKPETSMRPEKDTPGPTDSRSNWLRGPLEAGVPRSAFSRSPGEIGLPKFGMARVTPDGPRGPLASAKTAPTSEKGVPLATFRSPYEDAPYGRGGYRPPAVRNYAARNNPEIETMKTQASIETGDKDSIRAQSVASTLSAPDVIAKR